MPSDRTRPARLAPLLIAALAAVLGPTTPSRAVMIDVLPDLPVGPVSVRLEVFATGLGAPLDPVNNSGSAGFSFPTGMTFLPDGTGRALVMTLGGTVYIIQPGQSPAVFHSVIDPAITEIRPRNFGPIAIAAAPDFASSGRFYTIETERENTAPQDFGSGSDHQDVVYEYTMADPSADTLAASGFTKRQVLRIAQPSFDHNVNDLAFLPDGTLLVACGDGANTSSPGTSTTQLNAANTASIYGKVLRILPIESGPSAYTVPSDNPLVGAPGAIPEIYTYGHRNPFRVTVDALTGDAWVGEVGQRTVEEINRLVPGANYGWPSKEGSFLYGVLAGDADGSGTITQDDVAPDPDLDANGTGDYADANGLTDPIFEYDHGTGHSVAGGFVYRGAAIPELYGMYVFGDTDARIPGGLFYADPADGPASGQTGGVRLLAIDPAGAPAPAGTVGFAQDPAGELYLLTTAGDILKVAPVPDGCPADLDGSGSVTLDDIDLFVHLFLLQDPAVDFDGSGSVTLDDVDLFAAAFLAGCP